MRTVHPAKNIAAIKGRGSIVRDYVQRVDGPRVIVAETGAKRAEAARVLVVHQVVGIVPPRSVASPSEKLEAVEAVPLGLRRGRFKAPDALIRM